jgi:glycine/D-amino acid oxidase-like deaminating enzyme
MPHKLDLRTGRPVWTSRRRPSVVTEDLKRDIVTEILVVGMGISGAMMAEALVADGHDVVCVDRRGPIKGSTPATTALVQFEIDQPLSLLQPRIGRDAAEQAWRRSQLSLGNLESRITQLGIACDLERRPSLYLDGNVLGPGDLRREADARRRAGLYADYLTPSALKSRYGIEGRSAILSHGNLALDPLRLTAGLLREATAGGCRLYAPVEVASFTHHADGVDAVTAEGPIIRARHVVLCTGYELAADVPAAPHQIISTWAIATRPQPRALWPEQAFIWEAVRPLSLHAHHGGRPRHLRRRGRGLRRTRRGAMPLLPEKTEPVSPPSCKTAVPADSTRPPNSPGPAPSAPPRRACPTSARCRGNPRLFAVTRLWRQRHHLFAVSLPSSSPPLIAGNGDSDHGLYALSPHRPPAKDAPISRARNACAAGTIPQ